MQYSFAFRSQLNQRKVFGQFLCQSKYICQVLCSFNLVRETFCILRNHTSFQHLFRSKILRKNNATKLYKTQNSSQIYELYLLNSLNNESLSQWQANLSFKHTCSVEFSIQRIKTNKKRSSGEWFRSTDPWVMSPVRFHCATPLSFISPSIQKS